MRHKNVYRSLKLKLFHETLFTSRDHNHCTRQWYCVIVIIAFTNRLQIWYPLHNTFLMHPLWGEPHTVTAFIQIHQQRTQSELVILSIH